MSQTHIEHDSYNFTGFLSSVTMRAGMVWILFVRGTRGSTQGIHNFASRAGRAEDLQLFFGNHPRRL